MNVDERVGQNIRKYRMAYNMTLKELAVLLHKSVSTVSKYEKGDISLDMSTFVELSRILKVSPLAIIGDETASGDTFKIRDSKRRGRMPLCREDRKIVYV